MAVYLVCEGSRQGLDDRVLNSLAVQFYRLTVLIEPGGGSKGQGAVRTYLESRSPRDVGIAIEDRDYRPRAMADGTWADRQAKRFIWRRHEIENYVLHPRVVLGLSDDIRATSTAWASSLPATESDVSALLQDLAPALLEDFAAEVLRDELVRQINHIGSLSFSPPRPIPPGAHTCGQAQWVPALEQEAARLCQTCNTVAGLPDLQPGTLTARYNAHLAQFQDPAFLASGDYLVDMKGKYLLAALSRRLHGLGAPSSLDQDALADALLQVLERIYQPNSIYQPDDFFELAAILRQY